MNNQASPDRIPFNKPFIVGQELEYIEQAVKNMHLAGDGSFTARCQSWMEERFAAKKVLLTTSCTTALEMSAILTGIEPGDEVIMPSYTFVSTANAFMLRGAKPRFVDVKPDTLNMDADCVAAAISDKVKAIVPVHYAGVGCEMNAINKLAAENGIAVIEDAAQGVNATYQNQYLGTLGDIGTYSFHETKNFIAGEGGAIVLNRPELVERAEIIREKGTNRKQFFRGEVDKYTWVDIGSSFLPSELIAAFLFAQLEKADHITTRRTAIYERYKAAFSDLAVEGHFILPHVPDDRVHNAHMFYLVLPSGKRRDDLIEFLRAQNIQAVFHYVPLHSSPLGLSLGYAEGDFPVTEDRSRRLIRLPCYFELSEAEQQRVIDAVIKFVNGKTHE